jgi:hypothetical protein
MNLMRTTKPGFDRRALATQAMQAAIACGRKPSSTNMAPSASTGSARRWASQCASMHQHAGDVPAGHAAAHPPLGAPPAAAARFPPVTGGLNLVISAAVRGFFGSTPKTGRGSPGKIKCKQSVIRAIPANETGVGRGMESICQRIGRGIWEPLDVVPNFCCN